jgi:AraC family transcriptional activator of pyochelin receptor
VFGFGSVGGGAPATLRLVANASAEPLGDAEEGARSLSCIVARTALDHLFGGIGAHEGRYHLTTTLRTIALAAECSYAEAALETYRVGKGIELFCETMLALTANVLVPLAGENALNQADGRRLVAARRIIDEQWSEKPTLDSLARACGINRAKLTRGFRELYRCTAAQAALHRTDAQAVRLVALAEAMAEDIEDMARVVTHDIAFHRTIAEASGNALMTQIVASFAPLMAIAVPAAWRTRTTDDDRAAILERHRALARAIANRDADAARAEMDAHFAHSIGVRLAIETSAVRRSAA